MYDSMAEDVHYDDEYSTEEYDGNIINSVLDER